MGVWDIGIARGECALSATRVAPTMRIYEKIMRIYGISCSCLCLEKMYAVVFFLNILRYFLRAGVNFHVHVVDNVFNLDDIFN